ncbi:hypothetical protein LTR15_011362 [Elasticomyces elasticus]|nr:hypothetical protein LTR15_011362 [Elasticomyces elasticus]
METMSRSIWASKVNISEVQVLWLKHYEVFCYALQRNPPLLRFRSELESAASAIHDMRFDLKRMLGELPGLDSLIALPRNERLACKILKGASGRTIKIWCGYLHHPAHPDTMSARYGRMLESNIPPDPILGSNDHDLPGMDKVKRYDDRLKVEYRLAVAHDSAVHSLHELSTAYLLAGDQIGVGLCKIMEADTLLSPPFTSPLALNLIVDGRIDGWDNPQWDVVQSNFALRSSPDADLLYDEALELMRSIGCGRGEALVAIRKAAITHAKCLEVGLGGRRNALLDDAKAWIDIALEACHGDDTIVTIALCHDVLLDITRENQLSAVKTATTIGRSGATTQNLVVTQFAGLLMLRHGRMLFTAHAKTDAALLACRSARVCFRESQDPVFELQALLAEGQLHRLSSNTEQAMVCLDEIYPVFFSAASYLESLSVPATQESLTVMQFNLLAGVNSVARAIYSASNDDAGLQKWDQEYRDRHNSIGTNNLVASLRSATLSAPVREVEPVLTLPVTPPTSGRVISDNETTLQLDPRLLEDAMIEARNIQSLSQVYENCNTLVEGQSIEGNRDAVDDTLRAFLVLCDNSEAPLEFRSLLKIVALSRLGEPSRAHALVAFSIAPSLGGQAPRTGEDILRNADNVRAIDYQQLERAISVCFIAQDWTQGRRILDEVASQKPGLLDPSANAQDLDRWMFETWAGAVYEHTEAMDRAFNRYLWALNNIETRRLGTVDLDSKRGSQTTIHTQALFTGLARVCLFFNTSTSPPDLLSLPLLENESWLDRALLYLEQGCARTLLDVMIAQREANADELQAYATATYEARLKLEDLKRRRAAAREQNRGLEDDGDELRQLQAQSLEASRVLAAGSPAIARILSSTRFDLSARVIKESIAKDQIVVYTSFSRQGTIILGITDRGIETVHQSPTTDIHIERLVFRYIYLLRLHSQSSSKTLLNVISAELSDIVLRSCRPLLTSKKHVTFVTSAALNAFPLSALLWENRPLILTHAVSQVPSLAVLAQLTGRHSTRPSHKSAFVLANDHAKAKNKIPGVKIAAAAISRLHSTKLCNATDLESDAFKTMFEQSSIVHIGTHGILSPESPWRSSISLKDPLLVMELAKFRSCALVVVFAACLSGLGRATQGNDILGFSHAILQSGALNYMGALWNVSDIGTMMLMFSFHERLATDGGTASIAECWRYAQAEMYDLDGPRAVAMLKRLRDYVADELKDVESLNYVIRDVQQEGLEFCEFDFQHPYFWAPFRLVGYGAVKLNA